MRLSAGADAEHAKVATCVDLYFETRGVQLELPATRAVPRRVPNTRLAWQLYHNGLARLDGSRLNALAGSIRRRVCAWSRPPVR